MPRENADDVAVPDEQVAQLGTAWRSHRVIPPGRHRRAAERVRGSPARP